jgi:hypothetical protein
MTRRSRVWPVVAVVFFFINFAGGILAAAQGELLHAGVHFGLLFLGAYYVRRIWRRGESVSTDLSRELTDSLKHLERSVEAVGIEVERLGEGQRFITRLFTEKDTTRAPGEGVPEPVKNKGQS